MKIIHLGIYHRFFEADHYTESYLGAMKKLVYELVVESQFMAAKFILEHPNIPVVHEGYTEDLRCSDYDVMPEPASGFNHAFPNGFPSRIEELTPEQKELLYEHGGVDTLFYLNKIPTIYKSIHADVGELFMEKVNKKLQKGKDYSEIDYVSIKREKEAMECSIEAAKENFSRKVNAKIILYYGISHDFEPLCNEYGIEHELVNTGSDAAAQIEIPTFEQYNSSLIASAESPAKEKESPEKEESIAQGSRQGFFFNDSKEEKDSTQDQSAKNNPS